MKQSSKRMYSNRIPAAVIASAKVVVLVHREPPSPNQRVNCPSGETYSQCHFSGTVVAVGSVPAFASAALRPEPDAEIHAMPCDPIVMP